MTPPRTCCAFPGGCCEPLGCRSPPAIATHQIHTPSRGVSFHVRFSYGGPTSQQSAVVGFPEWMVTEVLSLAREVLSMAYT